MTPLRNRTCLDPGGQIGLYNLSLLTAACGDVASRCGNCWQRSSGMVPRFWMVSTAILHIFVA